MSPKNLDLKVHVFSDQLALTNAVADEFVKLSRQAADLGKKFNVALSGGTTPSVLFACLSTLPFKQEISWNVVNFYWGDERCVPPNHPESNYGTAWSILLKHIEIPNNNIHRIRGEAKIEEELERYSQEVKSELPIHENSFPRFDWVFLGLGKDGHTASLFPDAPTLFEDDAICTSSLHPQTGQNRISLTIPIINTAKKVSFLVTGNEKRDIVDKILNQKAGFRRFPASHIHPVSGKLEWYLDKAASPETFNEKQ